MIVPRVKKRNILKAEISYFKVYGKEENLNSYKI